MGIPLLSEAFCGCELATGTKTIAWIYLVIQGIILFIVGVVVTIGAAVVQGIDQNRGSFAGGENHFGPFGPHDQSRNIHVDGSSVLDSVKDFGLVMVVLIYVMLLIPFVSTILLLIGAAKEIPKYMLPWLILTTLSLIYAAYTLTLIGAVTFILELYFIWVVYSYFMKLRKSQASSRNCGPEAMKFEADIPCTAPPAYLNN